MDDYDEWARQQRMIDGSSIWGELEVKKVLRINR